MSAKGWFGTWNNYTEENAEQLAGFIETDCTSGVIGKEVCPSTGTPHLQFYFVSRKSMRLAGLKKIFGDKPHWEIMRSERGSTLYCGKEGNVYYEKKNQQGRRTDLEEFANRVLAGERVESLAFEMPTVYTKFNKGLEKLERIALGKPPKWTDVEVTVLIGKAGIGKTKYIMDAEEDPYYVMEPHNGTLWFCEYINQEAIVLDDFYGWIKYHYLLRLLDGYPLQLQTKGGSTQKRWKRVYITSNANVEDWYPGIPDKSALMRRIHHVVIL